MSVETHILNFNEDLYDKELELLFLYRIRDELKFDSTDGLVHEIQNDINVAIKRGFSMI